MINPLTASLLHGGNPAVDVPNFYYASPSVHPHQASIHIPHQQHSTQFILHRELQNEQNIYSSQHCQQQFQQAIHQSQQLSSVASSRIDATGRTTSEASLPTSISSLQPNRLSGSCERTFNPFSDCNVCPFMYSITILSYCFNTLESGSIFNFQFSI